MDIDVMEVMVGLGWDQYGDHHNALFSDVTRAAPAPGTDLAGPRHGELTVNKPKIVHGILRLKNALCVPVCGARIFWPSFFAVIFRQISQLQLAYGNLKSDVVNFTMRSCRRH
jgi:hypothetical protein